MSDDEFVFDEEQFVEKDRDFLFEQKIFIPTCWTRQQTSNHREFCIKQAQDFFNFEANAAHCVLSRFGWNLQNLLIFADGHQQGFAKAEIEPFDFTDNKGCPFKANNDLIFDCPIMFVSVANEETDSCCCGHRYSSLCWEGFLKNLLDSRGVYSVLETCIEKECPVVIPERIWRRHLNSKMFERFKEFQFSHFIETNKSLQPCAGKSCTNIFYYEGTDTVDVECDVDHKMCFACQGEPHLPFPCSIIAEWQKKCDLEAKNASYVVANTKPCPKCSRPIEKNSGCMRIMCICKLEFCWLCMKVWSTHGYQVCNTYRPKERNELFKESKEKYLHFYERFLFHSEASSSSFREKTMRTIWKIKNRLSPYIKDLEFIDKAVEQIFVVRQFLKFSYAYAYFMDFDSLAASLFECHQGQLEQQADVLNNLILEKQVYGRAKESNAEVEAFSHDCINKTAVLKDFLKTMKKVFEDDFSPKK